MKRYTPDEFADRLAKLRPAIRAAFRRTTPAVRQRVAGRAIGTYMRDAGSEPVRRDSEDTGPLRITSRPGRDPIRYLKAVKGGEAGSVDRIEETAPLRVTYSMGVDTRVVPQGVNETGSKDDSIPARPTFLRAIQDEAKALRRIARDILVDALRGVIR